MSARAVIIVTAAMFLSGSATAQPAGDGGSIGRGVVTGTDVYVRCGPGSDSYYFVTKVDAPQEVIVVGRQDGWLQIEPVPGCYSVISKEYVRREADAGTVTGENVRVRAAGDLRAGNFWREQLKLDTGDTVRILGEVSDRFGDWYKIAPPEGAYFWISADYVRMGEQAPAGPQAVPEQPAAEDPVVAPEPVTRPAAPDGPAEPAPPAEPTEPAATQPATMSSDFADDLEAFKAAEADLQAEYRKPAPQRDLPSLLARFKSLDFPEDSPLQPYVRARVAFLEAAIAQRREIETIEQMLDRTATVQQRFRIERTQTEARQAAPEVTFAARGVLVPSEIFTGGPYARRRYLLRDPRTRRIVAYVQSTGGQVALARYTGLEVGVMGKTTYDRDLAVDVIEASRVVVLGEEADLPGPPRPRVETDTMPTGQQVPQTQPAVEQMQPAPRTQPALPPELPPLPRGVPGAVPPARSDGSNGADDLPATGLEMVAPATGPADR